MGWTKDSGGCLVYGRATALYGVNNSLELASLVVSWVKCKIGFKEVKNSQSLTSIEGERVWSRYKWKPWNLRDSSCDTTRSQSKFQQDRSSCHWMSVQNRVDLVPLSPLFPAMDLFFQFQIGSQKIKNIKRKQNKIDRAKQYSRSGRLTLHWTAHQCFAIAYNIISSLTFSWKFCWSSPSLIVLNKQEHI